MSSFVSFLWRLCDAMGMKIQDVHIEAKDEYELAAKILHEINKYFYQSNSHIPMNYISEFHQYWEQNHEKILAPVINPNDECLEVARILESIYSKNCVRVQLDTLDLTPEEIANVRFYTSIQDFKIDINAKGNPFEIYRRFPDCFDPAKIVKNELLVDTFLRMIGAEDQGDKRRKWMINASKFLLNDYDGSAYNLYSNNEGDVEKILFALTSVETYGFSTKKAHMFLRDMADLGVWQYVSNVDKLDVMSDKNTMRVALRTGILQFRIPLLASYLDVYCSQYELVDRKCRESWRVVWERWGTIPNNHRPPTPASMDYLIYRLGKNVCKKSTRICKPSYPISEMKKQSLIPQDQLVFNSENYCIFNNVCKYERRILNPPNSISIQGMTGWNSGKSTGGGGGGISS